MRFQRVRIFGPKNKQAAVLSGIPVDARLTLVYPISGGVAGLGAIILSGRMNSGFPLAGTGAEAYRPGFPKTARQKNDAEVCLRGFHWFSLAIG